MLNVFFFMFRACICIWFYTLNLKLLTIFFLISKSGKILDDETSSDEELYEEPNEDETEDNSQIKSQQSQSLNLANDVINENEEMEPSPQMISDTESSNKAVNNSTSSTTNSNNLYKKNSKKSAKKYSDSTSVASNQSSLTNNLKQLKKSGKSRIIRSMQNLFSRSRSNSTESLNNHHNNNSLISSLVKNHHEHQSNSISPTTPSNQSTPPPPALTNPGLVKSLFVSLVFIWWNCKYYIF